MVTGQRHALPASAVERHSADRAMARHAAAAARWRPVYTADALGVERRVRTHDRVARTRSRRHHAHADGTERSPPLTVLRELARGVAEGRAHAVPAGEDRAHADARAINGVRVCQ